MASIISQASQEEFSKAMRETLERERHLDSMEDEFAKDWIIKLQQEVRSLRNKNGRILKAAGNSAFSPLIY